MCGILLRLFENPMHAPGYANFDRRFQTTIYIIEIEKNQID